MLTVKDNIVKIYHKQFWLTLFGELWKWYKHFLLSLQNDRMCLHFSRVDDDSTSCHKYTFGYEGENASNLAKHPLD